MRNVRGALRSIILASTIVTPAALLAQTASNAGGAATEPSQGLEDIIVTAQRRGENLQDVPLAVSAIGASALQSQGASDIQRLSTVTPGLVMTNQRGALQPYLRGVGTQNTAPGDEGSIALYIDGIYQPSTAANTQSLSNIDRIEVLRGPQGTLFGRNASGGLINIVTRDPSQTPRIDVTGGYANYKTVTGTFYGSTGISDTLAADFAAAYTHQGDGWGHNVFTGADVNKRKDLTLRSKILFTPTDDLKFTLTGSFGRIKDDRGVTRMPVLNKISPFNKLIDGFGLRPGESVYDSRSNISQDDSAAKAHSEGVSLKINYDAGWAQLQSLTAYNKYRTSELFDQDGTNLGPPLNLATVPGRSAADAVNSPLNAYLVDNTKAAQQEFLLTGTYGKLDLTSGAFIYYARSGFSPIELRSNALSGGPFVVDRASFNTQYTHSYAGFAQGTFHITPKTGLTVGLRYTIDDRRIDGYSIYYASGAPLPPVGSRVSSLPATKRDPVTLAVTPFTGSDSNREFQKLTYRFALDHHFTDDILAYVSYSRGFKSGVFNTTTIGPAVNPEVLDSAAAGLKTDLFDRHVRLNIEGFHYNYKNLQVSQIIAGTTALLNAAKAKIYGVDVEAAWSIPIQTSDLRLSSNFSLIHAEYSSFPGAPAFYPAGTTAPSNFTGCAGATRTVGQVTCVVDASGNDIINTPKRSGTVAADYTYPFGDGNKLNANVTYYFNSGYAGSYDATVHQPSYHLLSASAGATILDGKMDVRVWGSNLTKAIYYLQFSHAAYGLQGSVGAPRTYGVTVGYHFSG